MAHVRRRVPRAAAALAGLLGACLLVLAPGSSAQDAPGKEYQVKAVFLFNFARFVEWPDSAFEDADSPLVMGVLGRDPFNAYLDEVVEGERVDGRPIEVRRFGSVEEVKDCHILFVGAAETARQKAVLGALKSQDVLTVGETDLFAREGGMVCFVKRQGRIRFRVNLEAVEAAHLTMSSKLLRLAEIIPRGGG